MTQQSDKLELARRAYLGMGLEWVVERIERLPLHKQSIAYARGVHLIDEARSFNEKPVGPREFVESELYLNKPGALWPLVLKEFEELNSGQYDTAILTGGIGTAKTTISIFTQAYQLYLLSCLRSPHKVFNLIESDEIVFIFQSLNKELATLVDYQRFRELVEQAPYFRREFPFDMELKKQMIFPHRIVIKPVSGSDTAAIGQNVIGGMIDEVNFMDVIEESKRSKTSDGGVYDQAQAIFNAIARRRESRFMVPGGRLPGVLCVLSSKQYPNEFTDRQIKLAREEELRTGKTYTFVYDKRRWDIRPDQFENSKWFRVFIGDDTRKPRILKPEDVVPESEERLILPVPEDYRKSFNDDLLSALRDIGGVATQALHPYMGNVDLVAKCFDSDKWPNVLTREWCDFEAYKIGAIPKDFYRPTEPRWVHLDLAITNDSAGVSCGYVDRFMTPEREGGVTETMPVIRYDFNLEVRPPPSGEITFEKIRSLIYKLTELGLNIRWVSMDSFQSRDTLQILRTKGYVVGEVSMDKTVNPYSVLKSALYDGRVEAPEHELARHEITRLEWDAIHKRVDHPPRGSKDVADAMAGVAFGLTTRKATWARHGVASMIPPTLRGMVAKHEAKVPEPDQRSAGNDEARGAGNKRHVRYGR
jgi:hypothetical protein